MGLIKSMFSMFEPGKRKSVKHAFCASSLGLIERTWSQQWETVEDTEWTPANTRYPVWQLAMKELALKCEATAEALPLLGLARMSKNARACSPPAQPAIVLKQHSKRACTKQLHVRIKSSWPLLEHWARDRHMASHCQQRQPTKSSKTNVKVEYTWQFAALHKETNRRKAMCPQRCAYKVVVALDIASKQWYARSTTAKNRPPWAALPFLFSQVKLL